VFFTVDQAYRINANRRRLRPPADGPADATPSASEDRATLIEIHCECPAQHCIAELVVLRRDYERLRPEHRQLLVPVGHELDTPLHVCLRTETYELGIRTPPGSAHRKEAPHRVTSTAPAGERRLGFGHASRPLFG